MSLAFGGGEPVCYVWFLLLAHAVTSKSRCYERRFGIVLVSFRCGYTDTENDFFIVASQKYSSLWILALIDDSETGVFGRCVVMVCLVWSGCRC